MRWRAIIGSRQAISQGPMSYTVTLSTYFRAADGELIDPLGPAAYVAGIQDKDDERWGIKIPLRPEDVEPVVLANARFSISMRLDGSLVINADGLSDAAIDRTSEKETALAKASLDALVREAIRPEFLAMEDDPKADLERLQGRLKDALALVGEVLQRLP